MAVYYDVYIAMICCAPIGIRPKKDCRVYWVFAKNWRKCTPDLVYTIFFCHFRPPPKLSQSYAMCVYSC